MRAILTYHSIDGSGSPVSVDEAAFRRHVDWLASGAVDVVPLERILEVDERRVRIRMQAVRTDSDAAVATVDETLLHMDMTNRRPCPADAAVVARLQGWAG